MCNKIKLKPLSGCLLCQKYISGLYFVTSGAEMSLQFCFSAYARALQSLLESCDVVWTWNAEFCVYTSLTIWSRF